VKLLQINYIDRKADANEIYFEPTLELLSSGKDSLGHCAIRGSRMSQMTVLVRL